MTNPPSEHMVKKHKAGFFASLRNSFFTGVVVALPIGVTLWLVVKFVDFVDTHVKPIIPAQVNPDTYLPFPIPGFGILVSIVALWMLGALATNFFGSRLLRFGERLFSRVPVVSNLIPHAQANRGHHGPPKRQSLQRCVPARISAQRPLCHRLCHGRPERRAERTSKR